MDLQITVDDVRSTEHVREDATYRLSDAGLLVVTTEQVLRLTCSPMSWRYIEESTPRPSLGLLGSIPAGCFAARPGHDRGAGLVARALAIAGPTRASSRAART